MKSESLSQRQKGRPEPLCLLKLERGQGFSLKQKNSGYVREPVNLEDDRQPGIDALGAFREYGKAAWLRRYVRNWHLSYFTPGSARIIRSGVPHKHLNPQGDNLGNVVLRMEQKYIYDYASALRC